MGTFRIYFLGLICHFGEIETEKESAVVLKGTSHIPFISTEDDAEPLDDVKAIRFRFNGEFDRGRARPDDLVHSFVPRLQKLMGGRFDTARVDDLACIVEYPASREGNDARRSELSVAQLYDHKAVHVGRGEILRNLACVARMTVLTVTRSADSTMDVVLVLDDGTSVDFATVEDKECLLIGNISPEGSDVILLRGASEDDRKRENEHHTHALHGDHSHQKGEHVRHYGAILREENDFVVVAEDYDTSCTLDTDAKNCKWIPGLVQQLRGVGNRSSTHSECGNTTWP